MDSFLQVILENVTTLILNEFELEYGLHKQVKTLMDNLEVVLAFLTDASERQQSEEAVKKWLDQLRDVSYDANDLLDIFSYEARRRQLIRFATVRNSLSIVNPKRGFFRHELGQNIKDILKRLADITSQKTSLDLVVQDRTFTHSQHANSLVQTTSMNSSSFGPLGREEDKRRVIDMLIAHDRECTGPVSVISVLGMCGLGKTTLAQLVYNDERVERYFEMRLWVHVSRDFEVTKITKSVIEAIDSASCESLALDGLQKKLKERLSGRRYLLVLDDVWNEKPKMWETLMAPMLHGARGSKILVTTRRNNMLGAAAVPRQSYSLSRLSEDDIWSLFCQRALGGKPYLGTDVDQISYAIVNKCKGLPSAAEAIGCRLGRESNQSKWGSILQNEMLEFSGEDSDIICSGRMSYDHLPKYLKPCFAYCSILPKGFVFDKKLLIELWISQNFLQGNQMEDDGERYFDSLVEGSFFQVSHFDYKTNTSKYTMHSVIHELAGVVSGAECRSLDCNGLEQHNISEKTRHVSLVYGSVPPTGLGHSPLESRHSSSSSFSSYTVSPDLSSRNSSSSRRRMGSVFERVYGCKGLYTLLVIGDGELNGLQIPEDLARKLKVLRTLDLSNSGISHLPESIGELQHLRYLQLRNNTIKRLPESLSSLYNLQTLGLANCYWLEELPKDTSFLRKLRHLDLRLEDDTATATRCLRSMPRDIGDLVDLRTLSRFIVSQEKRCQLSELENLNNLHGELQIANLELVMKPDDAKRANLLSKPYLQQLDLKWGNTTMWCPQTEEPVLQFLQPHTNLNQLKIFGYKAARFPSWVGDAAFNRLSIVELSNCKGCETLPPLGQLPSLKALYIKKIHYVKLVDCTLCGNGRTKFMSLEKLHFEIMPQLQAWASGQENCELPALQELVVKNCGDLRQLTHKSPRLTKLVIENSPWLMGLPTIPSLQSLEVRASNEMVWESVPRLSSLNSLIITHMSIKTVPFGMRAPLSLRRLEISYWLDLEYMSDDWIPVGLTYLAIKYCPKLRCLPRGLKNVHSLEDMEIESCGQLRELPDWLPQGLQFLSIDNCPELSRSCLSHEWSKIAHLSTVWIDKKPVISSKSFSKKG